MERAKLAVEGLLGEIDEICTPRRKKLGHFGGTRVAGDKLQECGQKAWGGYEIGSVRYRL
jgi:hypothetical protein